MKMTTSEHLAQALVKFQKELRRAGAGRPPEPAERAALVQLQTKLAELSDQTGLDSNLQAALGDTAATLEWLLEDRKTRLLDLGGLSP